MGLFRRDPERKAAERRARWLGQLDDSLQGLGSAVLAELPAGWQVGRPDRERFRGGLETFGVAAGGPAGEAACGVSMTESGALEALLARLRGQLKVAEVWVPDAGENREAASLGSLDALEAFGWEITTDGESYGLYQVDVTAASASLTGENGAERIVGVVVGGGRDRPTQARDALERLVRGELEAARLWAPV